MQNSGLGVVLARGHFADPLTAVAGASAAPPVERQYENLASAVRQVRGLYSVVDAGQAELDAQRVAVERARNDVARREGLVASGAVSAEELAHARDQLSAAQAALSASQGQLSRNRAMVDSGNPVAEQPQVRAAAAQVRQAYLALQRASIVAPVFGIASSPSPGAETYVAPTLPSLPGTDCCARERASASSCRHQVG